MNIKTGFHLRVIHIHQMIPLCSILGTTETQRPNSCVKNPGVETFSKVILNNTNL